MYGVILRMIIGGGIGTEDDGRVTFTGVRTIELPIQPIVGQYLKLEEQRQGYCDHAIEKVTWDYEQQRFLVDLGAAIHYDVLGKEVESSLLQWYMDVGWAFPFLVRK